MQRFVHVGVAALLALLIAGAARAEDWVLRRGYVLQRLSRRTGGGASTWGVPDRRSISLPRRCL